MPARPPLRQIPITGGHMECRSTIADRFPGRRRRAPLQALLRSLRVWWSRLPKDELTRRSGLVDGKLALEIGEDGLVITTPIRSTRETGALVSLRGRSAVWAPARIAQVTLVIVFQCRRCATLHARTPAASIVFPPKLGPRRHAPRLGTTVPLHIERRAFRRSR